MVGPSSVVHGADQWIEMILELAAAEDEEDDASA